MHESRSLKFLYQTKFGRIILKIAASRSVSKLCGAFLDSHLSKPLIKGFVKKNNINTDEFSDNNWKNFNACFSRKIKPEFRPFDMAPDSLVSPCDGLISAYNIAGDTVLPIKASEYTISELLKNAQLAERFHGGVCLVIRLCVDNYHRYSYLDSGRKGENVFIKGILHTVRPIALRNSPVFLENCREYTILETENFGSVAQIEVGAMLVGKIKNLHSAHTFTRGEEKGMFLYGGSTVILLLEKDKAKVDAHYFENTQSGIETPVKMGQKIGEKLNNK